MNWNKIGQTNLCLYGGCVKLEVWLHLCESCRVVKLRDRLFNNVCYANQYQLHSQIWAGDFISSVIVQTPGAMLIFT